MKNRQICSSAVIDFTALEYFQIHSDLPTTRMFYFILIFIDCL